MTRIRAKTNNISPKRIALEMKVSESTVKRVWMYWMKNRELLIIKKFSGKYQELDEESVELITETHKKQKLGARRLEKTIEFEHGVHIPHNKIHRVLLEHGLANESKNKKKRRKAWIRYERKHSLTAEHLDWHSCKINGKELCAVLDPAFRSKAMQN
jgi:putative transposase